MVPSFAYSRTIIYSFTSLRAQWSSCRCKGTVILFKMAHGTMEEMHQYDKIQMMILMMHNDGDDYELKSI